MRIRRVTAILVVAALAVAGVVSTPLVAQAAPIAPTGLSSTALGSGSVRLSWDAAPAASAYRLQVSTESTFGSSAVIATYKTYGLDWITGSALSSAAGRTLYWRVAAYGTAQTDATLGSDSNYETLDLAPLSVPSPTGPGTITSSPPAVLNYPNATVFTWTPVAGAISYKLEYTSGTIGASDSLTVTVPDISATSYSPSAPLSRKDSGGQQITWKWRVQANLYNGTTTSNPVYSSAWSSVLHFTIRWIDQINQSTLFPANGFVNRYSDIRFSWDVVPGAAKYRLDFGREKTVDGTAVQSPTRNDVVGTTYVPTAALIDTSYYWQVTPLDINGVEGVASSVFEFTKKWAGQDAPVVASGTTATYPQPISGTSDPGAPEVQTFSNFELKWQPFARATLYEVEAYRIDEDADAGVVTCRTAGTSATIIAKQIAGAQVPGKLVGSSSCLWNTAASDGEIAPGSLWRWRVRAINYSGSATTTLQAANPVGAVVSEWSDPQSGDTSKYRYVQVSADPEGASLPITLNSAAFANETVASKAGQPAPVLTWNAIEPPEQPIGAKWGYEVRIYDNADRTSEVARARTPSAKLRLNGVLDDNSTSQAYFASVRRYAVASGQQLDGSSTTYYGDESVAMFEWTKSSKQIDIVANGITPVSTKADGTVLLSWQPQSVTGSLDGGSRGYQISISKGDSPVGNALVEYPNFVAQNPATGKPLSEGNYKFVVYPLDANGRPGKVSTSQDFSIAVPVPATLTSEVKAASAALTWKTSSPAAEFEVQYKLSSGSNWVTVSDLKQTAFVARDLVAGTYDWQVRSYDAATGGNPSGWSEAKSFVVGNGAIALSTPNEAVLPLSERVLAWEPFEGASRYVVQISENSSLSSPTEFETSATSFAIPDLRSAAKAYYWRVKAVPEKVTAIATHPLLAESGIRSFTLHTAPIAPALGTLTLAGSSITANWALLTGAAAGAGGEVRYVVEYRVKSTSDDWSGATSVTTSASASSFTATDLPNKTTFQFRVSALNSENLQGPWSAVKELQSGSQPIAAPTNLKVTPALGGLALTWAAVTGANLGGLPLSGYVVRYRPSAGGSWTTGSTSSTSITLSGLGGLTAYDIEVAAANPIGEGPAAVIVATTLDFPAAPGAVAAIRGDRTITVTWSTPTTDGGSPITGYTLEQATFDAKTKVWSTWATATVAGNATNSVRTGLINGNTYRYRLTTKTKVGSSAYSSVAEATPAGKPAAPLNPKLTTKKGKFILKWSAAVNNGAPITGYVVQFSTNGKKWKTIKTVKGTVKTYTAKKGKKGKPGYFRIAARNALGSSTYTPTLKLVRK